MNNKTKKQTNLPQNFTQKSHNGMGCLGLNKYLSEH